MNLMTTIARYARQFRPAITNDDDMEGVRFSAHDKTMPVNTVLSFNQIVELMDKHHISYHPNLVALIVDVEAAVRKHIAEHEQPKEQ